MGEGRVAYRVFVGRPVGKNPFERPRHTCEDNINTDLHEAWTGVIWLRIGTGGGCL
jgi:hypothetical protein